MRIQPVLGPTRPAGNVDAMRAPDTGDRAPHPSGPRSPADHPDLPAFSAGGGPAGTGGDGAGTAADAPGVTHVTPAGPWPTVRPPSTRATIVGRAAAVVAVVWYGAVFSVSTDVLSRSDYLLAGVVVGGILSLVGVLLLWLFASRSPSRVAPERGPDMGLPRDRAAARKVLRSGGTPDGEQRRLVAIEVQADAKLPLVTGATFALLGPLVVAVNHYSGTFGPLGPVTSGLILLLLAGLGWRTWSAWSLHRAADRKHTVPRYAGSGAPWRPWP